MLAYDFLNTVILLFLVLLVTVAYSMRVIVKGRAQFDRVNKQGGSVLLGRGLMEMAYWGLQPIARLLVFLNVTPNQLSWSSLVLGGVAGTAIAYGYFGFAALFATYSGLADTLDGMVARMTGVASDAGEVLDAAVDRYVEFFFLAGVAMYYRENGLLLLISLFALTGSFMISYSTAKAEALHIAPPAGIMRRPERALYLTLGCALSAIPLYIDTGLFGGERGVPLILATFAVAVLTNTAAIERFWTIGREMRLREKQQVASRAEVIPHQEECRPSVQKALGVVVPASQPENQKVNLVTTIPGPKSKELRDKEDALLAPGLQGFALMAGIVVEKAQGSSVTDVDGNTFLDIIGGIGVNGLGHSHPKFVSAIKNQVDKASVGSFSSEARLKLLQKVNEHAWGQCNRAQLYSGGAEAVESAMRLAKCFTGKYEFVSFWGGFHGKTMGVLSLMGSDFRKGMGPFVPGSHTVPYANCYRCPLKLEYPDCGLACVDHMRSHLKQNSAGAIAAFLVEPMQGTAGNVIPPKDFLPAIKSVAKEMDALLIVDEMITGFGRTGRYWGSEHSGVEGDIMTVGKQFGGGYPISALLSRDEIVDTKPWGLPSGSSSSYGGNPLASAAVAASLQIIDEEKLVDNSNRVGEYFLSKIRSFEERYSFVGQVRGSGLFMAIELVKDKKTKEPLSKKACEIIFKENLRRGLLTMSYAPSFRIQPAMTIDTATVDNVVAILSETFEAVEKLKIRDL